MDLIEDLQQSIIQEAYRTPENRKKFGAVPGELVVPEDGRADVKIKTPNAPKLIAPIAESFGFRPTCELDDASSRPSVVFVGQVSGEYEELRVLWMPETTASRGEFLPQEGLEVSEGKSHGKEWLVGDVATA